MKKICAVMAVILLLGMAFSFTVFAEPVSRPSITSGNKICVLNLETGEMPMDIDSDVQIPATATAKMMTALVVYENVSSVTETVTVPNEASMSQYIGEMGLISAPRMGLTVGKEYTVKDLLCALTVSSSNDAGIALAYYVGKGDIGAFVEMMNDKAKAIGATNTVYKGCVGLNDGSVTTPYDSALIAAEFSKVKTLIDISSASKSVTSGIGTLHNKNYLTSDFLITDYKLSSVKGICAGQATEDGGYCLIAYYSSNELSYIICVMDASGEKRDAQTGKRWFGDENAYADVHKIVPWLKESFEIRSIISPDSEEYSFSIGVNLSAKKDSLMAVPTETVRVLADITAEKINYVAEPTFYQAMLDAPVEAGTIVGEVTIYQNGTPIATVPLATKEGAELSEMLSFWDRFLSWLESDLLLFAVKGIVILGAAFVAWSLGCFIFRIIKKYKNGMSKDYYPPTD